MWILILLYGMCGAFVLVTLVYGGGVIYTSRQIYEWCYKFHFSHRWLRLAWRSWYGLSLWREYCYVALPDEYPPWRKEYSVPSNLLPEIPPDAEWILVQDEYIQDISLRRRSDISTLNPNKSYWIGNTTGQPIDLECERIYIERSHVKEEQGYTILRCERGQWVMEIQCLIPILWQANETFDKGERELIKYREKHEVNSRDKFTIQETVFMLVRLPEVLDA